MRTLAARFAGYAILIFFSLVFLYPFVIQIANSFKTEADASANPLSPLPHPLDTASMARIFEGTDFPVWLGNSVLVTVIVTITRVLFGSMAGYALSRLRFPGRRTLFATMIGLMAVPGVVLLIPKFLVLNQIGIYNSYAALIVPMIADAAGVFIMKQFFDSIPVSIEEAARIDGAGLFRTFWSVVLPSARPALITLTILAFQGSWNEFPHTVVAVQDPSLFTLPRGLADLVSGSLGAGSQYPLKLGAALLATIPVAIIFVIFQRYFVRDANEGAEKG
jgi:multiple sugar transport system permease protein